jgi:hypothetical protein
MSDNARKTLGEFVSYEEKEFYGVNQYKVKYRQPNSADPTKEWNHSAIEADLSDAAIEMLVGLSAGERFCAHQDKDAKGYPIITNITDAKDAPAGKAETHYNAKYKNGGKSYVPKDETGVAVGAAWNNAEISIKHLDISFEDEDDYIRKVATIAWKIYDVKEAKGAQVKAAKAKATQTELSPDKVIVETKPLSRAELAKAKKAATVKPVKEPEPKVAPVDDVPFEPDLVDDDLDDVKF